MKKRAVEHWAEGNQAWKLGSGFLLRLRGVALSLLLSVATMGSAPFWWASFHLPNLDHHLSLGQVLLLTGFLTLSAGVIYVFSLRWLAIRAAQLRSALHSLSHEMRDSLSHTFEVASSRNKKARPRDGNQLYRRFLIDASGRICDRVADYVSVLCRDPSVGCSIRLGIAADSEEEGGTRGDVYNHTIARSRVLNANRGDTTEAIAWNKGIPGFFNTDETARQGILCYNDIKQAICDKTYESTKNDRRYPNDFTSMVVAPMNEIIKGNRNLIGLVCITSTSTKIAKSRHVDAYRFLADVLAQYYISQLGRLSAAGEMPDLTKRGDDVQMA